MRKSYIQRTENEDARRQATEEEVARMEQIEMELIKKLQQTQAVQKDAYQQLERAIKEPQTHQSASQAESKTAK